MYPLLFKVDPPGGSDVNSWSDFLKDLRDPVFFAQKYFLWIIIIMVMLVLLARLNNHLEERSVDKAIVFSRGFVGTITAFVVMPIAFILLINVIAFIYGLPAINLRAIFDWIWLTATTYYWIGKCAFGGSDYIEPIYDGNSLIRLLWLVIPISFVWLRTASTPFWKLMLLPLLLGMFLITRHRKAPETFLTPVLKKEFPVWFVDSKVILRTDTATISALKSKDMKAINPLNPHITTTTQDLTGNLKEYYNNNSDKTVLIVVGLIVVALLAGYFFKKPLIGAVIAILAVGVFIIMKGGLHRDKLNEGSSYDRQANIDKLTRDFIVAYDSLDGKADLKLSELSAEISKLYKAEAAQAPDSLCLRYHDYFFEVCEAPVQE